MANKNKQIKKLVREYIRKAIAEAPSDFDSDRMEPDSDFDFDYYIDQIKELYEQFEEFEMAIITDLDHRSDPEFTTVTDYRYEQMPQQVQRYLNAAKKQLDAMQKYIEKQSRRLA